MGFRFEPVRAIAGTPAPAAAVEAADEESELALAEEADEAFGEEEAFDFESSGIIPILRRQTIRS